MYTIPCYFPQNTDVTLRSYSGEKVPVLGKISVPVKYSSNEAAEMGRAL